MLDGLAVTDRDQQILDINQTMLNSVVAGDWTTYSSYCSNDISCFEAETEGHLVEGLPFHQYYFNLALGEDAPASEVSVTMVRPHLRWLHEHAVVLSYTRLTQRLQGGAPVTGCCSETRVWCWQEDRWMQVHVHRS